MVHKKLKINASLWVSVGHVFSQILRLGSNLILTRLLVPEVFGLMAIVNIILMGLAMLSDVGIGQSIIRHKDKGNSVFFNTAWTIQVVRGGALWLVCLTISFFLWLSQKYDLVSGDGVYSDPILPALISIVGFTAIIDGFLPSALFMNNRDLKMKRLTIIDLVTQLSSTTIVILWAWYSPTVWALVYGVLFGSVLKIFLLRKYLVGMKNKFAWDEKSIAEIFGFGKWIMLSSIVTFLALQGDRLLLGHYISVKDLGVYVIAFFMVTAVTQMFSALIHKVWFPVFCDIARSSKEELENTYYRDKLKLDSFAFFIGGLLMAGGSSIVHTLYDTRYADAGWMLEILSIQIAFGTGAALGVSCLMAKGISKIGYTTMIARLIVLLISIPVSFKTFGLEGVVWAVGLNFIIGLPIVYIGLAKEGLFRLKKELFPLPIILVGYFAGSLI